MIGENIFLKTDGDTKTSLASPLHVYGWGCAVYLLNGKIPKTIKKGETLYLCSDIVEDSQVSLEIGDDQILKSTKLPVLTELITRYGGNVDPIGFVSFSKVQRTTVSSIRLYICTSKGKTVSLGKNQLNCALAFRPLKE